MELHLRSLAKGLFGVGLFGIIVIIWLLFGDSFSLPKLTISPRPSFEPTLFPIGDSSSTQPTVQSIDIQFADSDPRWDWQWNPVCLAKLESYLRERWAVTSVSFALVDDPTLALGVAYPDMADPQAVVLTGCGGTGGTLTCGVSISKGEIGESLEVATVTAALFGVQEFFRPRAKAAWEDQSAWNWAQYALLISESNGSWQSDCLTVTRQEDRP